jgi:hypothetical protein
MNYDAKYDAIMRPDWPTAPVQDPAFVDDKPVQVPQYLRLPDSNSSEPIPDPVAAADAEYWNDKNRQYLQEELDAIFAPTDPVLADLDAEKMDLAYWRDRAERAEKDMRDFVTACKLARDEKLEKAERSLYFCNEHLLRGMEMRLAGEPIPPIPPCDEATFPSGSYSDALLVQERLGWNEQNEKFLLRARITELETRIAGLRLAAYRALRL